MKAHLIRFTASIRNLRGTLVWVVATLTFFNLLPKARGLDLFWEDSGTPQTAGSGTWTTVSFSGFGTWSTMQTSNTNSPWTDGSVAHFLGSGTATPTGSPPVVALATPIVASGIDFDPGATTFTINTNGNTLTINGAGIVNTSGQTQTITNNGALPNGTGAGSTIFGNNATAGNAVINNDGGAAVTGGAGGFTQFMQASTAANAAITNNGGTINGATGGVTAFFGTSTAANATITNNGGAVSGAGGGMTDFTQNSSAGSAAITNNGSTVSGVSGGMTDFSGASTAGRATITNNGGAASSAGGGITEFSQTTTAVSAAITNNGGTASGAGGGITGFSDSSTAANATITNNGGKVAGAGGGSTNFSGTSTAGNAVITNDGSTVSGANGGVTEFLNSSTAGSATITSNGGTGGGSGAITLFVDGSDGGTGRAITHGNGSFDISGLTTAGMGIGSIEGSGNFFLGSKTLTVGGNNLSTTVSGVIQDGGSSGGIGGSLTKIGSGTLTLTGINTYTGATTVNAGSLIVDGSIASAQTLVNAGGLLGGHGSLGGSLVNSGIVSPGDSPGTLTVISNYTQNAAGTLRIEVAGLAPSEHDLLAVNGHASLAGTLQLIGLSGFTLHVGDQVTFLTANGGVSGSFGTVQNQLATGTLVKAQVVDLPNSVVLEGTQGSFVQGACNPNSVAVAQALNSAVGNPRASTLIAFLDDQPLNNLCGDFTLIAPEALASIFNAGVSLANVQTANLIRRMEDIRAGSTGFSSSGFTLNSSAPNFSGGFAGVSGPEGKSGPSVMTPTPENRWGVWVTGIGEFTNVDSTDIAAGYDIQSGGVTLGVDYRFTSCFAIGLTAGYAHINADLPNGGNLDVNAGQLGLYATVFGSGFYADAAIAGGPSGYDSRRTALLGSANGNTDGGNFNVLIAAGYDWQKGGLSIGPTANFQYTYVGFSSFTESGSLAPLTFPSQNSESERTAFGMKASYDWKVGHVIIKPEISLAWQHEFGDQSYSIVSSFANGAGNSFTVNSPQVGRDSLLIGAGAAVLLSDRISLYAYYDGEQLRTNYESNSVSVGVRMTF